MTETSNQCKGFTPVDAFSPIDSCAHRGRGLFRVKTESRERPTPWWRVQAALFRSWPSLRSTAIAPKKGENDASTVRCTPGAPTDGEVEEVPRPRPRRAGEAGDVKQLKRTSNKWPLAARIMLARRGERPFNPGSWLMMMMMVELTLPSAAEGLTRLPLSTNL